MKHPHGLILEKLYTDFSAGDYQKVLGACADGITFQVPGNTPISGKFTKSTFLEGFATKLQKLSSGSYKLEVHDILASDQHAAVLATSRMIREAKSIELRTVHVWRFEAGKPIAWYEYPRDLHLFEKAWN